MNRRTLILLAALFIGLAVITFFVQNRPASVPELQPDDLVLDVLFPDLTAADVQAVRLRDPATDAAFLINRAVSGAWTAPDLIGALNPATAENIAATVLLMPYSRTIPPEEQAGLETYGFASGGLLSVEILLIDTTAHVVAVGGENPARDSYYALVDDRLELYLLERSAVDYLRVTVENPPVT